MAALSLRRRPPALTHERERLPAAHGGTGGAAEGPPGSQPPQVQSPGQGSPGAHFLTCNGRAPEAAVRGRHCPGAHSGRRLPGSRTEGRRRQARTPGSGPRAPGPPESGGGWAEGGRAPRGWRAGIVGTSHRCRRPGDGGLATEPEGEGGAAGKPQATGPWGGQGWAGGGGRALRLGSCGAGGPGGLSCPPPHPSWKAG